MKSGTPDKIRTCDLLLRRHTAITCYLWLRSGKWTLNGQKPVLSAAEQGVNLLYKPLRGPGRDHELSDAAPGRLLAFSPRAEPVNMLHIKVPHEEHGAQRVSIRLEPRWKTQIPAALHQHLHRCYQNHPAENCFPAAEMKGTTTTDFTLHPHAAAHKLGRSPGDDQTLP